MPRHSSVKLGGFAVVVGSTVVDSAVTISVGDDSGVDASVFTEASVGLVTVVDSPPQQVALGRLTQIFWLTSKNVPVGWQRTLTSLPCWQTT